MDKQELLFKIIECVESGKINKNASFPPSLRGKDGADEYTSMALDQGIPPLDILNDAFIPAMEKVGQRYAEKKIFVPQMLISAKAFNVAMERLKPFFESGKLKPKGTFIIGTVIGDLHDIGKNIVSMIVKGAGWDVIDLGVDTDSPKFLRALNENKVIAVGLSALLSSTMLNMEAITSAIKKEFPEIKVMLGGAPASEKFCKEIGADNYSPGPKEAVLYLNSLLE